MLIVMVEFVICWQICPNQWLDLDPMELQKQEEKKGAISVNVWNIINMHQFNKFWAWSTFLVVQLQ